MRLEQLLYHENLCGWNSYYTTRTYAVGTAIIPREPMRLEQLLYHENLCGWNSYYTTRTYAVGTAIIPREPMRLEQLLYHENLCGWNNLTIISREPGNPDDQCGWANLFSSCLISQRHRAMYFFILIVLACVIFIDGINSYSIISS